MNGDRETCTTGYLNYYSYGFFFYKPEVTVTIDSTNNQKAVEALASCRLTVFRPDDELWVAIIITRQLANSHWDGYAFSRLEATFGETVWSYQTSNPDFCDGCYDGRGYWIRLKKQTLKDARNDLELN